MKSSYSAVAGQFFFLGGEGATWASEHQTRERNLGGPGENPREIFEVFIRKVRENAPNFKN